jgi:hypothetical protein
MPDHSDTFKVVQHTTHFKAAFSMAAERAIAAIALTTRRSGSMRVVADPQAAWMNRQTRGADIPLLLLFL